LCYNYPAESLTSFYKKFNFGKKSLLYGFSLLFLAITILLVIKIGVLSKFENNFWDKINQKHSYTAEPTNTETQEAENNKAQSKLDNSYSLFLENGKLWLQTPKDQNRLRLIVEEPEKEITNYQMTSDFKYIFYLAQSKGSQFLYRYNTGLMSKTLVTDSKVDKFLISPNERYIAYDKHIKVAPYSCCGSPATKDTRPWAYIIPIDGGVETKVKSPYIDRDFEIDGSKVEESFGSEYFPCVWNGFTEEGYFVIYAGGTLDSLIIPFSIDFQGNPLEKLRNSEVLSSDFAGPFPENVSSTYSVSELNGFPVYPNAEFIKILKYPHCQIEKISHQICNAKVYKWETVDNFDQVNEWYVGGGSNSAWKCSGGAGNYFGPLGSSIETSCNNGPNSHTVSYSNNNEKTTIRLEIPM